MRRWIAIAWHASFLVLAAALYFLFVLPRWFELTGAWPVGLGTPLRIVCGVLVGLTALPVVFTLLHTRKPEFGTPRLALTMRVVSIVLHVLAGVLIAGAAITEIWVSLDTGGQWLFGVYGAAAAIAVLGALAFYLAYLAELPPPPPKPLKPKKKATRRSRTSSDDEDGTTDTVTDDEPPADAATEEAAVPAVVAETTEAPASADTVVAKTTEALIPRDEASSAADTEEVRTSTEDSADPEDSEDSTDPADSADSTDPTDSEADGESRGRLRNRRTGGKRPSRFGRRRGGIALDE